MTAERDKAGLRFNLCRPSPLTQIMEEEDRVHERFERIARDWHFRALVCSSLPFERPFDLVIAIMGGFAEPPALWLGVHWFGVNVLPPIFLVGGLPSAVQALRGRPFKSTLLISVCAFALAWLPVLATVFWLPRILGWSW